MSWSPESADPLVQACGEILCSPSAPAAHDMMLCISRTPGPHDMMCYDCIIYIGRLAPDTSPKHERSCHCLKNIPKLWHVRETLVI